MLWLFWVMTRPDFVGMISTFWGYLFDPILRLDKNKNEDGIEKLSRNVV